MLADWPVAFIGFPLLIIGTPLACLLGRRLGRHHPTD